MRKEVIIAISFGLIVGLVITIGMYRARTALEEEPHPDSVALSDEQPTPEPSATPATQTGLIVREPSEEGLSTTASISVTGATYPNRALVILVNEKEVVGMSDEQGNFSIPLSLTLGGNIIKIRVLNPGSDPIEITRTVVYEAPIAVATASDSAVASPSAKTKK